MPPFDSMKGSFLGPAYSDTEIIRSVRKTGAIYSIYDDFSLLCKETASRIADGKVVGWFQNRMEFGPRALGNRSILADARNPEMQKKLNLKIKKREGFRPFAPAVLEEDCESFFKIDFPSPYMLFVVPVNKEIQKKIPENDQSLNLLQKLNIERSTVPSVTHVDFSARPQTVNKVSNPKFHKLLEEFKILTGIGLMINTSFNVRGEPIVCSPYDAYLCFMHTDMDLLVMGNLIFYKEDQPAMTVDLEFDPD